MKRAISIILPNLGGGGAERLHVYLANEWVEQGHKVELILMQKYGELLPLLSSKISIVELGVVRIRQISIPVSKHLKKSKPDVIVSAMWPLTSVTVFAWLLSGRPGKLFLSDHVQLSVSCVKELGISQLIVKILMRITYPFANGIIAVSQGVKQDMCRLGGFPEDQIKVIYNPAATGVLHHREVDAVRDKLWGVGFRHNILAVGTLKAQKDHETLIRAFACLPSNLNAKLTILGEGVLRKTLENLIIELGLGSRISLPGFVVDTATWYRSADLFVLSSQWEGFGNVIVEALEFGVPVVSTNCESGPEEILESGRYGKLVPIQNPAALAEAMAGSLIEIHDREALKRRAKDFSVKKISSEYLNYFYPEGF